MKRRWQRIGAEAEQTWDATLSLGAGADAFQSFGWGEYRRSAGWQPQRWAALDGSGRPLMMAQLLTRTVAGTLIAWAPGGPVLRFPASDPGPMAELLEGLLSEVRELAGRTYIRFDPHVAHDPVAAYTFGRTCRRPLVPVNTRFSSVLDLKPTIAEILAGMAHKHRYNTRRALEQPIEWSFGNDQDSAHALAELYGEVVHDKRLRAREVTTADLRCLCESLGGNAAILVGRVAGTPVTALLTLAFAGRAFLMLPATGRAGRAIGAGYAMHYRLFEELRRQGVVSVDLGGLDPRARMADVDRFKSGFGGSLVEYVGEWEWASHPWLRWALGSALLLRRSRGSL